MERALIAIINLYQKTLSPDTGLLKDYFPTVGCRHYPRCSEYAKIAIGNHGAFKGILLGIKRVGRCQPWQAGGVDLSCNLKNHERAG